LIGEILFTAAYNPPMLLSSLDLPNPVTPLRSNKEPPEGALSVKILTTLVWLLPDRAVYFPHQQALLIADVHIGKAATFRSLGVPVPSGTTQENLQRISQLLQATGAKQLFVLGDLFHGRLAFDANTIGVMSEWRELHGNVRMYLVGGNHDASAGGIAALPAALNIEWLCQPHVFAGNEADQFLFCHEPQTHSHGFVFSGHWHPVQRLVGRGDSVRLPCFWQQSHQMILPAFGAFTGGHPIEPVVGDKIFMTDAVQVHDVSRLSAD
jgi:uncharacterized protein